MVFSKFVQLCYNYISFRTPITPKRNSTHKQSLFIYKLTCPRFISPTCISLYSYSTACTFKKQKNLTCFDNNLLNFPYKTYFSHSICPSNRNFIHLIAQTKNLRIFPPFFLIHPTFNRSIILSAKPSKYI